MTLSGEEEIFRDVDKNILRKKLPKIRENLMAQLTAPVRWTQSVKQMAHDGSLLFVESGPGKVLQGLVKKIAPEVEAVSA